VGFQYLLAGFWYFFSGFWHFCVAGSHFLVATGLSRSFNYRIKREEDGMEAKQINCLPYIFMIITAGYMK
jgi:hypothetical protein